MGGFTYRFRQQNHYRTLSDCADVLQHLVDVLTDLPGSGFASFGEIRGEETYGGGSNDTYGLLVHWLDSFQETVPVVSVKDYFDQHQGLRQIRANWVDGNGIVSQLLHHLLQQIPTSLFQELSQSSWDDHHPH